MLKKQTFKNAIWSAGQFAIVGICFWVQYKFIVLYLGKEHLGLWSSTMALATTTGMVNFGLSGGITKFIAEYQAKDDTPKLMHLIKTATTSILLFYGAIMCILYPILSWVLPFIINKPEFIAEAQALLPYIMAILWMSALVQALQSVIDGFHRMDLRSFIVICLNIGYLVLSIIFIPRWGLQGFAIANLIQFAGQIVIYALWIRRHFRKNQAASHKIEWFRHIWDKETFQEIWRYGLNFQIMSFAQLLSDPVTKLLITHFGGLNNAGSFELISKAVIQLRGVLVYALSALVPFLSKQQVEAPEKLMSTYKRIYEWILCLSIPFHTLIIIAMPLVVQLWIGVYDPDVLIYAFLLVVPYCINTLSTPAFFTNMSIGDMRPLSYMFLISGFVNVVLGGLLGLFWGTYGVLVAWAIATTTGASFLLIHFSRTHSVTHFKDMKLPTVIQIAAAVCSIVVWIGGYYVAHWAAFSYAIQMLIILALSLILLVIPFAFQPLVKATFQQFFFPSTPFSNKTNANP